MTNEDEPQFNPEELEEIAQLMDAIMEEEAVGYQMMFWISVGAAKELLESWSRYAKGSAEDGILCMQEFAKIVEQLKMVVDLDEKDI
jgi:hypothetical protein